MVFEFWKVVTLHVSTGNRIEVPHNSSKCSKLLRYFSVPLPLNILDVSVLAQGTCFHVEENPSFVAGIWKYSLLPCEYSIDFMKRDVYHLWHDILGRLLLSYNTLFYDGLFWKEGKAFVTLGFLFRFRGIHALVLKE